MRTSELYTVLLSDLKQLGHDVYPRPYSESKDIDNTLGVTLHFYPESVSTEIAGDSEKQRNEMVLFKCDVQSTDVDDDITSVLAVVDNVVSKILTAEVGNANLGEYNVTRDETTETIIYTVEFTYKYWADYR